MRKVILGSVGALALATPGFAADLPVQPRYSEAALPIPKCAPCGC